MLNYFNASRSEKMTRWFALCGSIFVLLVFWPYLAPAAEIDLSSQLFDNATPVAEPKLKRFCTVHSAKPLIRKTHDADGNSVNEVREIELLVQLPSESFARRILVGLDRNLLLDPRAPTPGEHTYQSIVEPDGSITYLPDSKLLK